MIIKKKVKVQRICYCLNQSEIEIAIKEWILNHGNLNPDISSILRYDWLDNDDGSTGVEVIVESPYKEE